VRIVFEIMILDVCNEEAIRRGVVGCSECSKERLPDWLVVVGDDV